MRWEWTTVLLILVILACCLPMLWMMMRGHRHDQADRRTEDDRGTRESDERD